MINKAVVDKLQKLFTETVRSGVEVRDQRVNQFVLVEKYLQKESDRTQTTLVGKQVNEMGDKSKLRDGEVPITWIQQQTAMAYLAGVFLQGEPIFAAVSSRQHEDVASQLTALSQRDQHRFGWRKQLLMALSDVLNFNLCAGETTWDTKRAMSVITDTSNVTPENPATSAAKSVTYEGNRIRRLDPYNLILDPTVSPDTVHEDGMYAGYVERMNYVRLKKFFLNLNNTHVVKFNVSKVFNSAADKVQYSNLYYRPQIRNISSSVSGKRENWEGFFGFSPTMDLSQASGKYEIFTLYARIIPKEFGISVPKAGHPQVFKLIWVNGELLYAEPILAGHEYLPIVVGQLFPGNDHKSFAEFVMDLQDMSSTVMRGSMDAIRRSVVDRALYDPTRIRKNDIDSANPVSKIPVTANMHSRSVGDAYHHIPFQDTVSGVMNTHLGALFSLADQTTGQNRAAQGNFIRGNKTMHEFETIMSNSDARMQLGAIFLEETFFAPTKEIVKINFFIHAANEEIQDTQSGQPVTIDPAVLRQIAPEFKMADGILPSTKIANTEVLLQALQYMSGHPTLHLEYDTGGMILSLVKQQGFTDMNSYKRTPEEQQQYMQMLGLLNAGSGQGNSGDQGSGEGQPQ